MGGSPARPRQQTEAHQERHLKRELHEAGYEHSDGEPDSGPGRTKGSTQPANTIITTLKLTGVNAAIANRRYEFRMLPANAVKDMNRT